MDPCTRMRGPLRFAYRDGRGRRQTKTVLGLLGERINPSGYCSGRPFREVVDRCVAAWEQKPDLVPDE